MEGPREATTNKTKSPTPEGMGLVHRAGNGEVAGLPLGATLSHPPGDKTRQAGAKEQHGAGFGDGPIVIGGQGKLVEGGQASSITYDWITKRIPLPTNKPAVNSWAITESQFGNIFR